MSVELNGSDCQPVQCPEGRMSLTAGGPDRSLPARWARPGLRYHRRAMPPEALHPLLLAAAAWPALGLAAALIARHRARRVAGRPLRVERGARGARWALGILHLVALAGLWIGADPSLRVAGSVPLALSLVLALAGPSSNDRVLGDAGVVSGWTAEPFGKLAEWRLTGEHLRFRVGEGWSAVACPPELQGEVRALLERAVAGRESRFRS